MADKIRYTTEVLDTCTVELGRISDELAAISSKLSATRIAPEAGGNVRVTVSLCSGAGMMKQGISAPASSVVEEIAQSVRGLSGSVERLASRVRRCQAEFEDTERELAEGKAGASTIVRLGDFGNTAPVYAGKADGTMAKNYTGLGEKETKVAKECEPDDPFIDTEYSKLAMQKLARILLNDPRFFEEKWKTCESSEAREAFLRELAEAIGDAYGVKPTNLVFVDRANFEISKEEAAKLSQDRYSIEKTEEGEKYYLNSLPCETSAGLVEEFSRGVFGVTYNYGRYYENGDLLLTVAISYDKDFDYSAMVGVIAHEYRHVAQVEVVENYSLLYEDSNLVNEYGLLQNDEMEKVVASWDYFNAQYEEPDDWNRTSDNEYDAYLRNPQEVDARYAERKAAEMVAERKMNDDMNMKKKEKIIAATWDIMNNILKNMPFTIIA